MLAKFHGYKIVSFSRQRVIKPQHRIYGYQDCGFQCLKSRLSLGTWRVKPDVYCCQKIAMKLLFVCDVGRVWKSLPAKDVAEPGSNEINPL